jgi:gluconolactonase
LPPQPTVVQVSKGYKFLEGPVWLADQERLFFSDMNFSGSGPDGVPPSTIYRLTPPDTVEVFTSDIHSNGLALDANGQIVACTHDQRSVSRVDPITAARSTIADSYMGDAFNSPNDAIVRMDGTIYFTDPTWQLGNRPQEIAFKGVYRIATDASVHLVSDDFGSPNGIALSPDEATLYVADDAKGHIRSFSLASDGTTSGGQVFATVGGIDGMAVDCAGNIYASSHQGIIVLDESGSEIGTIPVGQKPSNAAFGGKDRKTLYITTSSALYSIALNVPGLP